MGDRGICARRPRAGHPRRSDFGQPGRVSRSRASRTIDKESPSSLSRPWIYAGEHPSSLAVATTCPRLRSNSRICADPMLSLGLPRRVVFIPSDRLTISQEMHSGSVPTWYLPTSRIRAQEFLTPYPLISKRFHELAITMPGPINGESILGCIKLSIM